MYHNGGARYEKVLGNASYRDPMVTLGTIENSAVLKYQRFAGTRSWCSVSWIPTEDVSSSMPTPNEVRRRAMKAVFGGTIDPATVWSALPWSWLIDWFSDVGDFLYSRRNVVGFEPGLCYTMTHSIRGTDHYISGGTLKGSYDPPVYLRESKTRTMSSFAGPSAKVPFLAKRQIGILASLYILRR